MQKTYHSNLVQILKENPTCLNFCTPPMSDQDTNHTDSNNSQTQLKQPVDRKVREIREFKSD